MKKNVKFLVGGLVAVALVAAAYFGNAGGLFQGKISLNSNISKVELMKLLSVTLAEKVGDDLSLYTCVPFSDEDPNAWYVNYICYMYEKGFIKGNADGTFGLNKSISRAEAAKLFVAVFDKVKDPYGLIAFGGDESKLPAPYADVSNFQHWYFIFVYRAATLEIADVKAFVGAKFYPATALTQGRAQYWNNNLKKALDK